MYGKPRNQKFGLKYGFSRTNLRVGTTETLASLRIYHTTFPYKDRCSGFVHIEFIQPFVKSRVRLTQGGVGDHGFDLQTRTPLKLGKGNF